MLISNAVVEARAQAIGLAHKLGDAFGDFLLDNGLPGHGDAFNRWVEELNVAFSMALRLKAQVILRKDRLVFRWPRFGTAFDPAIMKAENEDDRGEGGASVQLSYFPSLTTSLDWWEKQEGKGVETVVHALVKLQ